METLAERYRHSQARGELIECLQERQGELERAILTRVYGVSDPATVDDFDYITGLRESVRAGLQYGIAALGHEVDRLAPLPPVLLAQARLAARHAVRLDVVLRRYFAGYALLGDFVIQIVEDNGLVMTGRELRDLWRTESVHFDRLVSGVTSEYASEIEARGEGTEQRRTNQVRKLLAGEFVDITEWRYPLDGWHLGLVASGADARGLIRDAASALDRNLLMVCPEKETVWAWLGGGRPLTSEDLLHFEEVVLPGDVCLSLGEQCRGLDGWRQTHLQATAVIKVACRDPQRRASYAKTALLASILGDEILIRSLNDLYLRPLALERDGGLALRRTLMAFFRTEHNFSCAAAALGVSRKTVANRLRTVEERIGRSVESCAAELEVALRLEELGCLDSVASPGSQ